MDTEEARDLALIEPIFGWNALHETALPRRAFPLIVPILPTWDTQDERQLQIL